MKKVFFVLAACAVVSAALVGCGSSSSTEGNTSAATSTAAVQNKGDIGPYHFEISDTARTEETTDGTALIVKYTITNNSDENIMPGSVTRLEVFQNGVSLKGVYIIGAEDGTLMENQNKTIQPGASLEVEKAFTLDDTTMPIQVSAEMKAVQPNSIKLVDGTLKANISVSE